MQSVRRLVKCEDSLLQILVLMSALGLARGQGSADQFAVFAFVLGGIFIWIIELQEGRAQ